MANDAKYVTFTDANFQQEVIGSAEPTLVDFTAAWCGPCRALAPVIEELAGEYAGKVKIGKLDVDNNPQISNAFSIRSIPTLLFFKDGRVVEQMVGAASKKELAKRLDQLVSEPA